ncbi:hypothetical protein PHLGIDRAFT_469912 [Phlebiopsis gigantea 11061_1 CR5-6]|uniref:Uncharacterized protein n=1 Tax=Phlebiopsis gigantea (strain 11061_1 CR5-6) TaxID=745531 RepID=A0A0C3PJ94_PHLG1|nr:hypothetical protein PHLGIDRAFT_469912 [Phlebiopsis gigantea 11061_1 CR5-6]
MDETDECTPTLIARRLSISDFSSSTPRMLFSRSEPFSAFLRKYRKALNCCDDDAEDSWSSVSCDADPENEESSDAFGKRDSIYRSQLLHFQIRFGAKAFLLHKSRNYGGRPSARALCGRARSTSYSGPFCIPTSTPRIPLEVIERIIKYCAADDDPGPALSALSSTCRTLHRLSTQHMYSHIIVHSAAGYSRLFSSLKQHILFQERAETLQIGFSIFENFSWSGDPARLAWVSEVPVCLPPLMPNLRSIILHAFPAVHKSFFILFRQFTSVVTLHVSFVQAVHSQVDLARILWALPCLQHAIFEGLTFLHPEKNPPLIWKQRRRMTPPLQTLVFRDCSLLWEEWMLTIEMKTLKTLVLLGAPVFPYDAPGGEYAEPGLLACSHDTLTALTIIITLRDDSKDPLACLGRSLAGHRHLRELNIGLRSVPVLADFNALLDGLSTEVLELLTFMFDLRHLPQLNKNAWGHIDDTLAGPKFRKLRSVTFIATDQQGLHGTLRSQLASVARDMPKAAARGILRLVPTMKYTVDIRMECECFAVVSWCADTLTAFLNGDFCLSRVFVPHEPPERIEETEVAQPMFERISDGANVAEMVHAHESLSTPWTVLRSGKIREWSS